MAAPEVGEAIETASRDELAALQLARLKATLRRVYGQVPRYRAKFDAAGVHPEELTDLADLARFPFTTKDDFRDTYPYGMFAVPVDEIVRLHSSSGTTGRSTVVGYTRADLATWSSLLVRSLRASGLTAADRIQIAFGYGLFTGGLGFHYGAEALGATVIPAATGFTARQVQLIADLEPTAIMATPSYLLTIADAFDHAGLDPAASSLRTAICGAEPWSEALRTEIETRLGLDAYDSYGLSELIGPGVAQECAGEKGGLTLWEDHFLPEIVDPETGAVLPDGEPGELVLTTLTKEGMPVVRYRTRDLTRLMPGASRTMRRIARIGGRSDDMLIIRGVNIFPSQIEAILGNEARLAPHYEIQISRGPNHLDHLALKVEMRPNASGSADAATYEALARTATHLIKTHAGVTCEVAVVAPGTLARFEGKAKRVIDARPKD